MAVPVSRQLPAWQTGLWLLIDAAGPACGITLIDNGQPRTSHCADQSALTCLQTQLPALLKQEHIRVADLQGCIFGIGPGSILGLRLAAMTLRTWQMLPDRKPLQVLQFHHLQAAFASHFLPTDTDAIAMAPWKRDSFHAVRCLSLQPLQFAHLSVTATSPEALRTANAGVTLDTLPDVTRIALFHLGNRAITTPWQACVTPFPFADLPKIFSRWPQLLQPCAKPTPFSTETAQFARWQPQRHRAP